MENIPYIPELPNSTWATQEQCVAELELLRAENAKLSSVNFRVLRMATELAELLAENELLSPGILDLQPEKVISEMTAVMTAVMNERDELRSRLEELEKPTIDDLEDAMKAFATACAFGGLDARRAAAGRIRSLFTAPVVSPDVDALKAEIRELRMSRSLRQGQHEAEIQSLKALSVTNIMIDIVPGEDGSGHEVYAKSIDDVETLLTRLSEKAENFDAVTESRNKLVRKIDVILNGEEGAAKQASLCDLVGQIQSLMLYKNLADQYGLGIFENLEAVRSGVEWQPIETAPRDTTRILINSERRGVREARFLGGNADDGLCFYDTMVGGGPMTVFYDVTHWKPLPAPPAIDQANGARE